MQTFSELEHKLLNQHHDHYVAFSRLLLSLATGAFALLAAFRTDVVLDSAYRNLALTAFPCLLVSVLAGILVQHRIMMNPIWHLDHARDLMKRAEADEPVEIRRRPSRLEMFAYRVQALAFIGSFLALVPHLLVAYAT